MSQDVVCGWLTGVFGIGFGCETSDHFSEGEQHSKHQFPLFRKIFLILLGSFGLGILFGKESLASSVKNVNRMDRHG